MSAGKLIAADREYTILSGLVTFVLRGIHSARIEVDADEDNPLVVGPVQLVLAADNEGEPVILDGTITEIDASTFEGRATAVFVGGKGKLASTLIPARTYQQAPFETPVASIATDSVIEAGEDFDDDVALAQMLVPRWHRVEMTAAQLLERLADRFGFAWRMNDDGQVVFAIDEWPAADEEDAGLYLEGPEDAQDRIIAGSVARASIRPGVLVRGRRIEEVHYSLDGDGLRVLMRWGEGTGAGGLRGDLEAATRRAIPLPAYSNMHAATVLRQNANGSLDVECADASIGSLTSVPYRTGLVGCRLVFAEGANILVGFVEGDESQPYCIATPSLEKVVPENVQPWGRGVARVDDAVRCGSLTFTAAPDGTGGIASIVITYQDPNGSISLGTLLPDGVPLTFSMVGKIRTGSTEVFLRANA